MAECSISFGNGLRVGVWVGRANQTAGGGQSFQDTVLAALQSMPSNHEFVRIGIDHDKRNWGEQVRKKRSRLRLIYRTVRRLFPRAMSKRAKIDTSSLRKSFDILYYPAPNSLINSTPSIITVWDLAHRLFPFFPEVSYTGWRWRDRECLYQDALKRAAYVIVGTEAGKDQVRRFYGVDTSRIRVIPFPARTLPPPGDLSSILPLEWPFSESFIFYPAQFWPHKNHAYLLQALSILRARGREIGLVLSGSDKGNREYVESLVTRLKLQHQVFFAGFVSDEGMSTLYREAAALVFPSLFGPDNLPPLEAMASGCPAVVADVEGAREQLSDAALYFDPLRPDTIADAISIVIEDSETKHKLIERGSNLVRRRAPDAYVRSLNLIIDEFRLFKRMWSQTYVHL